MLNFGLWNLIIIIAVALFLKHNWRLDTEKTAWSNSLFLKHHSMQRLSHFFSQPIAHFILQALIVLIVTRFLCYTGWLVYDLTHRPDPPYWDFKWFYVASKLAHEHLSPFNVEVFNAGFCRMTKVCGFIPSFVYPPNIIPVLWFLGYFPIKTAFTIWTMLHLIAIALVLWGANILLESHSPALRTTCTISIVLLYGFVFDLQVGNVASFIAVMLLWMFIFASKNQDILAGFLLGTALFKPTLVILFVPYFLIKRRFKLVCISIVTVICLGFIGLAVTGNSLTGFLQDATRGFPLWLNDPSNNAYISMSRIDLRVLGPRFFAHNPLVSKLFSNLIVLALVGLVSWYFYQEQSRTAWSKNIYLSEMVLISCLSIAINYSQPTSSVMLAPAVVFLLNDLCFQIKHCAFSRQRMSVWLLGVCCLLVQTAVIHRWLLVFIGKRWNWKAGELPYILKVTIFSLPSYAILGITLSVLALAITSVRQKQV
ncbi:glycosyltransferase family 87 protein [Microcoleus sp. bin38.metabat.b11b12b14.051]|uniref:glycosyltransferase family 87 protein n=1 Tax=Microcoleus sp. bin38.metabat.b11b12b14.051 TaxID=2742709 RepID=UPI0025F81131|nr:glycosyltransferase family 87 protein [Microcoleus sp. bin38.metabat.b11b12b14.051]